jgi:peptide chain release factor 1
MRRRDPAFTGPVALHARPSAFTGACCASRLCARPAAAPARASPPPRMAATEPMIRKLDSTKNTFDSLGKELEDPAVCGNAKELMRVSKARAALEPVVAAYEEWTRLGEELTELKDMFSEASDDAELREMARSEMSANEERLVELEEELKVLLLPKDPNDEKNCMLEIRAGTGGDEASIWAGDLVRVYSKYAESQGWTVATVSASEGTDGGYKECILEVTGSSVYSKLKYEAGVHRVQRVPATETQGRVHVRFAAWRASERAPA